jgi:iron complex outermembrane receptor protein
VLAPQRSRQVEIGTKARSAGARTCRRRCSRSARASNTPTPPTLRAAQRRTKPTAASSWQRQGKATRLQDWSVSLMALNTRQTAPARTGIDGKRVTDVPNFKSTAWVAYAVPQLPGLKIDGTWQYSGKKAFDVENRVFVPDYHVFGLGASYALKAGGAKVTCAPASTTCSTNSTGATSRRRWAATCWPARRAPSACRRQVDF